MMELRDKGKLDDSGLEFGFEIWQEFSAFSVASVKASFGLDVTPDLTCS